MASIRQIFVIGACAALAVAAPSRKPLGKRDALPDYAITYAPWSYLYSGESWWPSDIAKHLNHTAPFENYLALGAIGSATVNTLNTYSSDVYLTTSDPSSQAWLSSTYGKPSSAGYSAACGTIIAVEKNSTWTDVFYFHFYSYNYGGVVLGINFDDHIGDWEHAMIRFYSGVPYAIYLSEHGAGSAYHWSAMEFNGDRPVTYVANGGHANYATAGAIEYTIALGLIEDHTDKGTPWDMTQNYRGYRYDNSTGMFSVAGGAGIGGDEEAGETADWLNWQGQWGNEYNSSSPGQFCLFGQCTLVSGPTGPVAKNLGRTEMCQKESGCKIFDDREKVTIQAKRKREQRGPEELELA